MNSNDEYYDGVNLEEEEFYQQYKSMYDSDDNTDDYSISISEKVRRSKEKKQQQHEGVLPQPPTIASNNNNKKVELAKAWDEAILEESTGIAGASNNNGDGHNEISSLSDLQQRLLQIQKQNNRKPMKNNNSNFEQRQGSDALSSENNNDNDQDFGKKQAIKETAAELGSSDRYHDILRKAEERLSKMKPSSSGSAFNSNTRRMRTGSNMAGLQERLEQIQQETNPDADAGTESLSSEELPSAKRLDDDTLAEWEELENQLQREAAEKVSKKPIPRPVTIEEANKELSIVDESTILEALRSQAAIDVDVDVDVDVDKPSSDGFSNNGEDDSSAPDGIPANDKQFMSDYEVTNDGGIFLSPKAYQEACTNANPDGSLNFDSGSKDGSSDSQKQFSSPLKSAFVNEDPAMAPYEQDTGGGSGNSKRFTIQNLTREASRSIDYARDNPDAQEELHRRIMAEFESEESTSNEFEKELLIDPEKANAFWNQEFFDQQKEEGDSLDRLLDEKLRQLEGEEQEKKKANGNRNNNSNGVTNDFSNEHEQTRILNSQKQQNMSDRNIFFAPREERIQRRRMIERSRKERVKTIAKFYKDASDDSSWNLTSESKEVEQITKPQDMMRNSKAVDEKVNSKTSTEFLESKEEFDTSKYQENFKNDSTNKIDESENKLIETNQEIKEEGEWVLVEDPGSLEDAFYWNEATGEMRWDPPEES